MIKLLVGKKQLDSTHIACQKASDGAKVYKSYDAAIAAAVGGQHRWTTKFETHFCPIVC
ncbi:hypothetical protein VAS14_02481 [Photobacterium angustum S14]|uniref:Uncharacterized protein n=1 Tax=Photobacterium angustum (strain S14 / CCUG 15956) TaxID=314292 RepID=Q1ZPU9_PHOAS|nr:hypothetical protein VAS14_02481 [Photobacterium angustum S14]